MRAQKLSGRVKFKYVVNKMGRVIKTKVIYTDIWSRAVLNCLTRVVVESRYPEPRGGTSVTIEYPYSFNPPFPPVMRKEENYHREFCLPFSDLSLCN